MRGREHIGQCRGVACDKCEGGNILVSARVWPVTGVREGTYWPVQGCGHKRGVACDRCGGGNILASVWPVTELVWLIKNLGSASYGI